MKFALFRGGTAILRGEAEGLGRTPSVSAADPVGRQLQTPDLAGKSYEGALGMLLDWLNRQAGDGRIAAAGHRIVHGGLRFADPVRIDAGVLAELRQIVPLAPLHQPHGLAAVSAIARSQPSLLQVACFDTAFHRTMPDVATRLALPRDLGGPSLRRYGFHGLSYEFIAARLRELSPALAQGRVVAAHLGSGASLCAMQGGRSIETTMGFSTLDGLVMGTRPGALDAGVVLYLLQSCGMTDKEVEDVLYHRSGLLGVSGVSSDMRALAASTSPRARAAVELFTYRAAGEVARLASALGGLDGLVFTGGIGEHDATVRAGICRRLAWLGIAAEELPRAAAARRISTAASHIEVWIIPADEEAAIARHTQAVLAA